MERKANYGMAVESHKNPIHHKQPDKSPLLYSSSHDSFRILIHGDREQAGQKAENEEETYDVQDIINKLCKRRQRT